MKLEDQISDSDWVRAICIHEAGHIFYFRQFGATKFIYHGPRMDYDRENEGYAVQCAAVEPEPYKKKPMTFAEMLALEARLAVSGFVAVSNFTSAKDDSEEDYRKFETTCNRLNADKRSPKIDAEKMWNDALREVEADFQLPENRAAIIAQAEIVRAQIFPWATLPIDDSKHEIPNQP